MLALQSDGPGFALARELYEQLLAAGVEAVLDDRDERPGVKFNDADLIGYPLQITIGKRAGEGIVEVKVRGTGTSADATVKADLAAAGLADRVAAALAAAKKGEALSLAALGGAA